MALLSFTLNSLVVGILSLLIAYFVTGHGETSLLVGMGATIVMFVLFIIYDEGPEVLLKRRLKGTLARLKAEDEVLNQQITDRLRANVGRYTQAVREESQAITDLQEEQKRRRVDAAFIEDLLDSINRFGYAKMLTIFDHMGEEELKLMRPRDRERHAHAVSALRAHLGVRPPPTAAVREMARSQPPPF